MSGQGREHRSEERARSGAPHGSEPTSTVSTAGTVDTERREGAFATLRRGLRTMPEFRRGLPATFALALVATTTIDAARTVAGNDLLTARVELATEDGEAVCTATSMLVARGS